MLASTVKNWKRLITKGNEAVAISKVESYLSDRCSQCTGWLFVSSQKVIRYCVNIALLFWFRVTDSWCAKEIKTSSTLQSCPILPHCYEPLRAVNGPYVLHTPSLLLTVRMLSTYGACISLLHEYTMRYGSFDPYGPKTYGASISFLHQDTMRYGSFDPYSP